MPAALTVDFDTNAAYSRLCDESIVETCEVAPGVLVDLEQFRCAVGMEALDLSLPAGLAN